MSQPVPTPTYDALELPHQRFVDRLMLGDSKTDAYASAYPDASRESALSAGSRLFGTVRIQTAVAERKAQLAERVQVTPQKLVEELASVAFARMSTFASWGPGGTTLVDDTMLTGPDLAAVAEISEQPGNKPGDTPKLRIKLHPKMPAIDKLLELFDVTPEKIRALYPNVEDKEIIDGVVSIFRKAKETREAARQAKAGGGAT